MMRELSEALTAAQMPIRPPMTDSAAALPTGFPLVVHERTIGARDWRITAVESQDALLDAVRTDADVRTFQYGLVLWPSAIALAEWLAERAEEVRGRTLLELGCGAGLPGMVACCMGARVVQTDGRPEALALARCNAEANDIGGIAHQVVDWEQRTSLTDLGTPFDVVIGSDILYERTLHAPLIEVFQQTVAPGGLLVLADPLRHQALEIMDTLEELGWRFDMESRAVPWEGEEKEIAVFSTRRFGT